MLHLSRSEQLFSRAQRLMPGGVNSPVRSFGAVGGTPPFITEGKGARIWDADGNEYLDFVGSWGPLVLGHAHPAVVEAVQSAAADGTSFGAPTERELELAELITNAMPSIEMLRMVSSGTEAAMSAIRAARAFTNRSKIIKFNGNYHGHADGLLVKAGSGATTHGVPTSAGVPLSYAAETLVAEYNDLSSVERLLDANVNQVAAIIVEPVAGNMGVVPPADGFLKGLRQLCEDNGSLLMFDEVITGFRVGYSGAQGRYGVTPDLTCLGKIIGGGLPMGAYGGRRDVMQVVAPLGPAYQAGTLSGNPLATAAGIACLKELARPGVYETLETLVAEYNNLSSVERLLDANVNQVAAIIVEPVAGNMGVVPPADGFLEGLRQLCEDNGSLLVFDEVITGFRVGYSGAQGRYGVTPDLTCLGKIIGGGLPMGTYGGRSDVMQVVAPLGPAYQAGTLSGNPLATAAGIACLKELARPGVYETLEALGAEAEASLSRVGSATGVSLTVNRVGSMLTAFFTEPPVATWSEATSADVDLYASFFHGLLERGVYVAPSQFEAAFVSLAHTPADLAFAAEQARQAMAAL